MKRRQHTLREQLAEAQQRETALKAELQAQRKEFSAQIDTLTAQRDEAHRRLTVLANSVPGLERIEGILRDTDSMMTTVRQTHRAFRAFLAALPSEDNQEQRTSHRWKP